MEVKNMLRHKPVQKRSRGRVEEILHAAELIFNEKGYESTTTNAIAEKANIPIGSLYQYFKNKKAILEALSDIYKAGLSDLFDNKFAKELEKSTLYELSDKMLDALAQFYAHHTAFQIVLYGASRTSDLDNASDEVRQQIIFFVFNALKKMTSNKNDAEIRLIATILVAIARSLLPACVGSDGKINKVVLRELKKVIRCYLETTSMSSAQ